MKKIICLAFSATLLAYGSIAYGDSVVANYDGRDLTESQIMDRFKQAFDSQPALKGKKFTELDAQIQENLVRSYINWELLKKEAVAEGIESKPEFKKEMEEISAQVAQQKLVDAYVKKHVSEADVDKAFAALEKSFEGKNEVKASHILVETEEKAKDVKKELNKGAKFATVAKKYSKDEGTKVRGGSIGFFREGQLVPEFEQKAFAMKVSEVSEPIKTQFGWHIILVEDIRPVKLLAEEKGVLRNKMRQEAVELFLKNLNDKAHTKITLPTPSPVASDSKKDNAKK